MPGANSGIVTKRCELQEVIDKFNNQYNNISTDADKFKYIMKLNETIAPNTKKEKIYNLDTGNYVVGARRTLKNDLSPNVVRYYIDIYRRER